MYLHFFIPLAIVFGVLLWKLIKYLYEVATGTSGIHYVMHRPAEIKMNSRFFNPFDVKIDFKTASWSGVKCTLRCDGACYVQAMWYVPIYHLVEYLNKEWPVLINLISSPEPAERLRFHGSYGSEPFVLAEDAEKVVEFKIPSDVRAELEVPFSDVAYNSRTIYPFVILMVLLRNDPLKFPAPYVIASVHAVHLPDEALNRSSIIAQFIRLSSGHVGQVKKVFSASAGERNDLCLICYQQPASVVQLSCRHFCLCRSCYAKCDKCPVCRNTQMDFFELPPILQ